MRATDLMVAVLSNPNLRNEVGGDIELTEIERRKRNEEEQGT